MSKHCYTIPEVAEMFSVSVKSIQRAIERGEIISFRIGRSHRVASAEIGRLLSGDNAPIDADKSVPAGQVTTA